MEFNRGNLILGILCSKSTKGTERMKSEQATTRQSDY